MATWQPDLAPLVGRIPRLYSLLKALGDEMHADIGITTGMRTVISSLSAEAGRTVPDLARELGFSRQHIQSVINELLSAGLVAAVRNPSHRRSPLLVLTDDGLRRRQIVEAREAAYLTRIAPAVSHLELAAAARLFDHLERDLTARLAVADEN
jgi:DNA-binding MarR family transcriptional regulator